MHDLRRGTTVRPGVAAVLLSVTLALLVAVVVTLLQPRLEGARGEVLISPVAFLDPGATDSLPALSDTIVQLGTSPTVLRRAAAAFEAGAAGPAARSARRAQATDAWLRRHVELRPVGTSSVVEIRTSAPRARDAVDLAAAESGALAQVIEEARTGARGAGSPGIRLVALSPGRAVGPVGRHAVRNGVVAVIVGALAGWPLAIVLARRRRRRTAPAFAAHLAVPWLGATTPGGADVPGAAAASLLNALLAVRYPPCVVGIVTGNARAQDLATIADATVRALNQSGRRALLVHGASEERGIADGLVASRRRVKAAVQAGADGSGAARAREATARDAAALRSRPPVAELWPGYGFVVLHGPTGDALPPASDADCLLLVVDGDASPQDLSAMRTLAERASARRTVVGVVGVTGDDDAQRSSSS